MFRRLFFVALLVAAALPFVPSGSVAVAQTVIDTCPPALYPCGQPTPIPFPTGTTNPASGAVFTGGGGGAFMPTSCTATFPVNITTATTTQIVANSANQKPHVCWYSLYVVSGTTPGFQWEAGSGATCTSPTILSGTFGGIAGAVGQLFTVGTALGTLLIGGNNQSICLISSGTTPSIQGVVGIADY